VLLAPSWHALQLLLNILNEQCCSSDLTCNARKTVCLIFVPKNRHRMLSTNFPSFKIGSYDLQFVSHFKYFCYSITNSLSDDDDIRSMFVRCNLLLFMLSNCSKAVKLKLFQSFCLCFYDIAM